MSERAQFEQWIAQRRHDGLPDDAWAVWCHLSGLFRAQVVPQGVMGIPPNRPGYGSTTIDPTKISHNGAHNDQ